MEPSQSETEFFGSPEQTALLRRGHALHAALRDDPRMCYYGRLVGLSTPDDGDIDLLCNLVTLQGVSNYAAVPASQTDALRAQIEARGLVVTTFRRWTGAAKALARARSILDTTALPDDVTSHPIDTTSPPRHLHQLAEVATICGVLPPAGGVLRGRIKPGAARVATEPSGRAVCCAGAAGFAHPDHPTLGHETWWGMLATHPDRRGAKLSLILGAQTMLDMHRRYGAHTFMTGIQSGNAASESICARLGLAPDGANVLNVVDPAALKGGKMTR
jgi:hypothetical protein